jgi:predicted DNA-binding protein
MINREETMGVTRENPRYNVISVRISDEEKDTLTQLKKSTHKSVSDILREAMELIKTNSEISSVN